jgi:hypothetical protein
MAEFLGDDATIARQKAILERAGECKEKPWLASGGRTQNYVEPSEETWPEALAIAEADGLLTLALMPRPLIEELVASRFGAGWGAHYWDALVGASDPVLAASRKVLSDVRLPEGWSYESLDYLDEDNIRAFQDLNAACGVSANPAYMMQGVTCPTMSTMVRDASGALMAVSWAAMFYHPASRLGDVVFVGLVSVAESARGLGLGKYVNARVLVDSHAAMGWGRATEFVATDNPASRAMALACGLDHEAGLVASVVTRGGGRFTR